MGVAEARGYGLDCDTAFTSNLTEQMRAIVEPLHPFRGLGKPEDIAKAAVFLASEVRKSRGRTPS